MERALLVLVLLPVAGALFMRRTTRTRLGAVVISTLTLAGAALLLFATLGESAPPANAWIAADSLSALLIALTALVSWMVVLSAPRAWLTPSAISVMFLGEALALVAFLAQDVRVLGAAWIASLVPLYVGLRSANEQRAARVYFAYAAAAGVAFAIGIVWLGSGDGENGWRIAGWTRRSEVSPFGFALLLFAVLVRKAIFPFHSWLPPVFASRCLGAALLLVAPMLGAYALVRLLVPLYQLALGQPLALIGPLSLFTAVYAAGLALTQTRLDRVVAWLAMSQSAVVLLGLECHGQAGTVGAIVLWLSAGAALTAFGLVAWALESRYGPLDLARPRGLYRKSPFFAWMFLASGLCLVAMPGTIGFASNDLLLRAVLDTHPYLGMLLFVAVAANGFTVFRAFTRLFHGPPAQGPVIDALFRERVALIVPLALIVFFGVAPRGIVAAGVAAAGRVFVTQNP